MWTCRLFGFVMGSLSLGLLCGVSTASVVKQFCFFNAFLFALTFQAAFYFITTYKLIFYSTTAVQLAILLLNIFIFGKLEARAGYVLL